MKTLLFVCTGNSCRSPMAQAIAQDFVKDHTQLSGKLQISSAGTMAFEGGPITEQAEQALKEMKIHFSGHRARQINVAVIQQADLILTMEARHLDELKALWPDAADKANTLLGYANGAEGNPRDNRYNIRDPFGQPLEEYLLVGHEIKGAVIKALARLAAEETEL